MTSWYERFRNEVSNCLNKNEDLRSRICNPSQNVTLQGYTDYYREAKGDLDAYLKMELTPGLSQEIENKIRHYNGSCNGLYPMYKNLFDDECKSKEKSSLKKFLIFGGILLAILLIIIGFFIKKESLYIFGGIIIAIIGLYFISTFFMKKQDFLPFF